jgi:hypothetical protein
MKHFKNSSALADATEILELNKYDTEHVHHVHPRNDEAFLLTSSHHFDQAVVKLSQKLLTDRREGFVTFVELARGIGENAEVDVSYERLVKLIPSELFTRSVFIYIRADTVKRMQRNRLRKRVNYAENIGAESFFVPERAMDEFFKNDDFLDRETLWPCPVYRIENKDAYLDEYKQQLQDLAKLIEEEVT